MTATDYHNPPPTSSRERYNLLNLFDGLWLYVQFGSRMVRFGPSMMVMSSLCSERDVWIHTRSFALDQRVHCWSRQLSKERKSVSQGMLKSTFNKKVATGARKNDHVVGSHWQAGTRNPSMTHRPESRALGFSNRDEAECFPQPSLNQQNTSLQTWPFGTPMLEKS